MESIEQTLREQQAEIAILRLLALALFDQCPDQYAAILRFQRLVAQAKKEAPNGPYSEFLVELMTRYEIYLQALQGLQAPKSFEQGEH